MRPLLPLALLLTAACSGGPGPALEATGLPPGSRADGTKNDRLAMTVDCEVTCAGDEGAQLPSREATFNPHDAGLRPGNGNYYGMLGTRLSLWGRSLCAAEAASLCGEVANIAEVGLIRIRSGDWELARPVSCEADATPALVLSPYSIEAHPVTAANDELTFASDEWPPAGPSAAADETCAVVIEAQVCGGDCLVDPAVVLEPSRFGTDWVEALVSPKPNFEAKYKVCGDELVTRLMGTSPPRALLELECERLLWGGYLAGEELGGSCAATRGTVDCSRVLAALGR